MKISNPAKSHGQSKHKQGQTSKQKGKQGLNKDSKCSQRPHTPGGQDIRDIFARKRKELASSPPMDTHNAKQVRTELNCDSMT